MALYKAISFRIQHIPSSFDKAQLTEAIRQACDQEERATLELVGDIVPSCNASISDQTAIVLFLPSTPRFLKPVEHDKTGITERQVKVDSSILNIDRNFFGMTQLFRPADDAEILMDIVAVTGLDGNAFGSWASRVSGVMWLRDFLKEDLPNSRVMTYGYNTKLSSNMLHRFQDFCTQFLEAIQLARSSREAMYRPLVLIGHSYGSRIITKSVVRCKISDTDLKSRALLATLQRVVFFGAPHQGMDTQDIEEYLREQYPDFESRMKIVTELRRDDDGVKRELKDFIDLVGRPFRVISIYERKESRRLVRKDSSKSCSSTVCDPTIATRGQDWSRTGEAYSPIRDDSALLNLPLRLELQIPSESDHSNIAKFDHKDLTYQSLLSALKDVEAFSISTAFPRLNLEFRRDEPNHPFWQFTWLEDAMEYCRELQLLPGLPPADIHLLRQAEHTLWEAQTYVALAQDSACSLMVREGRHRLREIRTAVLEYGAAFTDLLRVFNGFDRERPANIAGHTPNNLNALHEEFDRCLERIDRLNMRSQSLLNAEISRLYEDPTISTLHAGHYRARIRTLAKMRISQQTKELLDNFEEIKPQWVPFESLFFPVGALSEDDREDGGWLEKIVKTFTKSQAQSLRLKPRRYGVLSIDDHYEKVMVEFRQYPAGLTEAEYSTRRWAFSLIARMLLSGVCEQSTAQFPSVPLRCLSERKHSSTPCFMFVYAAESLYGLDEVLRRCEVPCVRDRVWLALGFARTVASLHLAGILHGLINPYNLYLKLMGSLNAEAGRLPDVLDIRQTAPMVAGYDIARLILGKSDRLDVEDPDWRIYLHPDRLEWGDEKDFQHPIHDVFSLGMVMIVIGLWEPFTAFTKYQQLAAEERQEFAIRLRKTFKDGRSTGNMGSEYGAIISYCLGRRSEISDGAALGETTPLQSPFGSPRASRVVDSLTNLLSVLE